MRREEADWKRSVKIGRRDKEGLQGNEYERKLIPTLGEVKTSIF